MEGKAEPETASMKWTDSLRRRVTGLLTAPREELGRWSRLARFQIQFWRFAARRLRECNAMAMSAALSFRTLFAMVPVLIIMFLAFRALGQAGRGRQFVSDLLAGSELAKISYVRDEEPDSPKTRPARDGNETLSAATRAAATRPTTRPTTRPAIGPAPRTQRQVDGNELETVAVEDKDRITVAGEIERLVDRVERKLAVEALGPIGGILLVWSALTLVTTIERSLNRIFEAPRSRSLGQRIVIYWSLLTLGPVVLVGAWYAGSQAAGAAQDVPVVSWIVNLTSWIGPFIVTILVFAAIYKLMPNTRVSFRAAAGGAIVAVPLWMIFRHAFSVYLTQVGVTNIYGAIGIVPLFLLWLNLSWWIFLFGAQLSHSAAHASRGDLTPAAEQRLMGPWDLLAAAVAVARGHVTGESPVPLERVAGRMNVSADFAERLCERLCRHRFCAQTAGNDEDTSEYVLSRSADTIAVLDILEIGEGGANAEWRSFGDQSISNPVQRVRERTQTALRDLTLADILEE